MTKEAVSAFRLCLNAKSTIQKLMIIPIKPIKAAEVEKSVMNQIKLDLEMIK